MFTGRPLLTLWAQWATILHKVQTFTGYSPAFTGIVPKVPGIFQNGIFLLYLVSSPNHPLSLWKTQTSNILLSVFLLALASLPSSDFIAKNQLAREGSQSVSLVTIPALTTIVDRQLKEDRTLCPVQALRYYLVRTEDLRGSRSLLFISFKKGHTSDIRPAILSLLTKTNHPTLLQTSRLTSLGLGPS